MRPGYDRCAVDAYAVSLEPVVAVAVPATYVVAVSLIFLEFFLLRILGRPASFRGGATSLLSGGLAFGLTAVANVLAYAGALEWAWAHRVWTIGLSPLAWLAALLAYDFSFWLAHLVGHRVRLFWCVHSVHHTTTEMRLSTAVRGSALDFVHVPWFFVWVPLLGVHPMMLLTVEAAGRIWGVLTHVSPHFVGRGGRWVRALERWFVTPSLHRVHHGRQARYLDRNYGEVFSVWDRLFGTFTPEDPREPPEYGLRVAPGQRPIDDESLAEVQLSPWRALARDLRRAPGWTARLRYLFDAPGWSHEGPDARVRPGRRPSA